jgi:hypothetical protein
MWKSNLTSEDLADDEKPSKQEALTPCHYDMDFHIFIWFQIATMKDIDFTFLYHFLI